MNGLMSRDYLNSNTVAEFIHTKNTIAFRKGTKMNFATAIQNSKSTKKYLKKYQELSLSAEELPTANDLDDASTDEQKTYKRLASALLRLASSDWWQNAPRSNEFDAIIGFANTCKDNGIEISILSSPFESESVEGKLAWCKKHLEPLCIFTNFHIRRDKDKFASPNSLLIDDRKKVCTNFSQSSGHSVLFDHLWVANALSVINNNTISQLFIDLDGVLVNTHSHLISALNTIEEQMNTVTENNSTQTVQKTTAQTSPVPVFAGIIKVVHEDVTITEDTRDACEALTEENNLTPLPDNKKHCTLGHQQIEGLKQALKAQKKALKKGEDDPIILPATPLPSIGTIDSTVSVVSDVNPKNGEARKTVRIVLRQELQNALSSWVAELCELNNFVRDEIEMKRVYHISYSNHTGLPGDSVR